MNDRFPTTPDELAHALADPRKFGEYFPDSKPGAFAAFADAYSKASPIVAEYIQLQAQQAMQPGPSLAGMTSPGKARRGRVYSDRAPGVVVNSLFKGEPPAAAFVQAINPKFGEYGATMRLKILGRHEHPHTGRGRFPAARGRP